MASWKKVIVSGSAAELSTLTLDTALPVAQGGIGATSLTDKAVLISQDSGTDTIGALALTGNGEIIVGGTNGPAVEAAADVAGTGLDASTGDGTLAINVAAAQTSITSLINSGLTKIGTAADQEYIKFDTSNEVNVHINNTERFSVTATGADLTGHLSVSGDVDLTGAATDVDLIDNNASALSFDATGKAGILEIDTTNSGEGVKMSGNLTVEGDFVVNGNTTQQNVDNLLVKDRFILLNSGSAASGDAGIVIERGSDANVFIGYDESADEIAFGTGTFTGASSGDLSITNANIRAAAVTASGALTVDGATTLKGDVTLGVNSGDSTEDSITVTGRFVSSLEPMTTLTYELGSPERRWRDIYLSGNTIDLAGATISGDGTGAITISATGATLPAGSNVGSDKIAAADSVTGVAVKSVPLFTAAGGLGSAATTFKMAASSIVTVFTSFTKANGSSQSKLALFTF